MQPSYGSPSTEGSEFGTLGRAITLHECVTIHTASLCKFDSPNHPRTDCTLLHCTCHSRTTANISLLASGLRPVAARRFVQAAAARRARRSGWAPALRSCCVSSAGCVVSRPIRRRLRKRGVGVDMRCCAQTLVLYVLHRLSTTAKATEQEGPRFVPKHVVALCCRRLS